MPSPSEILVYEVDVYEVSEEVDVHFWTFHAFKSPRGGREKMPDFWDSNKNSRVIYLDDFLAIFGFKKDYRKNGLQRFCVFAGLINVNFMRLARHDDVD